MNDRKKASKRYYDRKHGNALAKAGYGEYVTMHPKEFAAQALAFFDGVR